MGIKALILSLAILAGCTTVPAPVENPRQVWCDLSTPRRHTKEALSAMSRAEIDEINAFNSKGKMWCGWQA